MPARPQSGQRVIQTDLVTPIAFLKLPVGFLRPLDAR
jgi:hypothetical protein